jgi:hypothetical protein
MQLRTNVRVVVIRGTAVNACCKHGICSKYIIQQVQSITVLHDVIRTLTHSHTHTRTHTQTRARGRTHIPHVSIATALKAAACGQRPNYFSDGRLTDVATVTQIRTRPSFASDARRNFTKAPFPRCIVTGVKGTLLRPEQLPACHMTCATRQWTPYESLADCWIL